ncbi:DUF2306 domain-containing protein [Flammeovirga yaeyamensis]|uniref:DUF2306 domain-containing protein n=1 Tax=Flammeovirga yaeyamensis TaxID=367791 RepID=A0AAX1N9L7_9BACT|nr:DUF2306 domain-containing protein [Flammeovirga yaeyamensis]MBB3699451.1 putative membrane protein [Flammeovirga yaeyamensis]QWG04152.1 DUF2306 domain-containing protein [Flammeovirga yaeyamensis]
MMKSISIPVFKVIYYAAFIYFSYLMLLITLQYIPIQFDVAFLNLKEEEIQLPYYQIAFFGHVYSSIFVLVLGGFQFSKSIRIKFPSIHKHIGKIYVFLILLVSCPSGFIMALHANGDTFTKTSFVLQAVLWFWFTYKAFDYVRLKNWDLHQKFMLRSFALTLSAISLRLFKWIIVNTLATPPMDTYKFVAWLGWVFNIAVIELYFYIKEYRKVQINTL